MQNFFEKMGVGEPSKGLGSKQVPLVMLWIW
jgi:hypothetical protein